MGLLIRVRANTCAANRFGVTPLHLTVAHAALERLSMEEAQAVALLCSHRADPAMPDLHGRTAIDVARMAGGDTELVEFLQTSFPQLQARLESQGEVESFRRSSLSARAELALRDDVKRLEGEVDRLSEALADSMSSQKLLEEILKQPSGDDPLLDEVHKREASPAREQQSMELQEVRFELEHERAELFQQKQELEHEHAELFQQTQAMHDEHRGWQRDLEIHQAQILQERSSQHEGSKLHCEQMLERERHRWNEELQSAVEQRKQSIDELQQARDDLELVRRSEQALDAQNRTWQEERVDLQQRLEKSHAELEGAAAEQATLQEENIILQHQVAAASSAASAAAAAAARPSTALLRKDEALTRKHTELERARSTVENLQTELSTSDALAKRYLAQLQERGQERDALEGALAQLREHHATMLLEEKQAAILHEQQQQVAEASRREHEDSLRSQIAAAELRAQQLQQEVSDFSNQVVELSCFKERAVSAEDALRPFQLRVEQLRAAFAEEQALRKRYHNQMQDLKGAVRVYARIRPLVSREASEQVVVRRLDAFQLELDAVRSGQAGKSFQFDAVFGEHSSQEEIFAECRSLVSSAVDGFNVTVFAYGQTGAGKTHTMYGSDSAPGLVPHIADELFSLREQYAHESTVQVRCQMLELYRDDLIDLLLPVRKKGKKAAPPPALSIKKDSKGYVKIEGVTEREVVSPAELLQAIEDGKDRRHVAATAMNKDSSRSHLIFIVVIESHNRVTKQVSVGKLTLCDLAGSERLKRSEAVGEQLEEAKAINKSLSALGDVIEALTKNSKHVPYRNHKLTQVLADSLGGNAKTLMFVNCSPAASSAEETSAALGYASRAKLIMNKVEKNQDSQDVFRLRKVIERLSQELEQARSAAGAAELAATLPLPPPLPDSELLD